MWTKDLQWKGQEEKWALTGTVGSSHLGKTCSGAVGAVRGPIKRWSGGWVGDFRLRSFHVLCCDCPNGRASEWLRCGEYVGIRRVGGGVPV